MCVVDPESGSFGALTWRDPDLKRRGTQQWLSPIKSERFTINQLADVGRV